MTFEELGISKPLLEVISKKGFTEPTEIQAKTIPVALQGEDVIGESATGSGKTLAFGAAILERTEPYKHVQSLVLTPTREIAEQVTKVLSGLARKLGHTVTAIYGGVGYDPQVKKLRTTDIVVGTPGRVLDHLNRRTLDVSKVNLLVLDEADRMLDMGFIHDVEKIINFCPTKRQTLLFSATLPREISSLASNYMIDPLHIQAANRVDPKKLNQLYFDIERRQKFSLLVHLLKKENTNLVMIFCNTKRMVDRIATSLKKQKVFAQAIHGGLTQARRRKVLKSFHDKQTDVLVCTDVAARGLDIPHVSHIYNYDIPANPTEYIHRAGRTARAGKEGKVINLVCAEDHENFGRVLNENDLDMDHEETPKFKRVGLVFAEQKGRGRPRGRNSSRGSRRPPRGSSRGRSRRR